MAIILCNNKEEWRKLLEISKNSHFLQSWEWGDFQQSAGRKIFRFAIENPGQAVGAALCIEHCLKLGIKYLYIPKCKLSQESADELLNHAKKLNYTFVRFEPEHGLNLKDAKLVKNRQPQQSLVLNLKKEDAVLLSQTHEKTRYNIRLAQKKGVKIVERKDINVFWKLNTETFQRDDFKSHDKIYYEKMLKMDISRQFTAYYENEPVASIICIDFGKRFTYLHGASGNKYRNIMAPYLLQWHAMQYAKNNGYEEYDFWGVSPFLINKKNDDKNILCYNNICWDGKDRLSSVTRFKVGFGGEYERYQNAFDIVLNKFKYFVYIVGVWLHKFILCGP
jgi:lipid II:glycine glycyltransferase (peptidoglycan interpeptide bridge formation enzyme)